jgi:hypothetical protein
MNVGFDEVNLLALNADQKSTGADWVNFDTSVLHEAVNRVLSYTQTLKLGQVAGKESNFRGNISPSFAGCSPTGEAPNPLRI